VLTRTDTLTLPSSNRPLAVGDAQTIKYDGGTVIVSAIVTDDFSSALLVYRLNAAGRVVGRSELFGTDSEPVRSLGYQDDVQDDTIVASGSTSTESAVYVFQRVASQWIQTQKITRPISDPFESFPGAVALNRNVLLIGDPWARFESSNDTSDGHSVAGASSTSLRARMGVTAHATVDVETGVA
jgi:hypothetical protein